MSRWRLAVVLLLGAVPLAVLLGIGSYALWHSGYGWYIWWPMTICMTTGYTLAWYWLRKRRLIAPVDFAPPMHWTDRDKQAFKIVEERAQELAKQDISKTSDLMFYSTFAQQLALDLARFYHPGAADPIGSLTVPEILAVVELAAHDLAEMVDQNVPGSHLLSINDWRWTKETAEKATSWYRLASNAMWLGAAVLSPIETAVRYAATRAGTAKPWQLFQQDLVAWFHAAFVQRLGTYLIDLNSGRLKVGAKRYREIKAGLASAGQTPSGEAPAEVVTLTVVGQTKMGKSSFINALLGEQKARTDVLPATDEVARYQLSLADSTSKLLVLDTVGYAHSGPRADQLRATEQAAQQADVILLVLHARNPARQADLEMLQQLKAWFATRPDLKMPPVLAVVTHIDLLSPAMEWAPPYDWQHPQRPKEKQIQAALTAVRDQLGEYLVGAVPVCTAAGKVYGIDEWFLPTLMELLGEARAVALLRCLRAEADTGKARKVVGQFFAVGRQLLEVWLEQQVNDASKKREQFHATAKHP